MIAITKLIMIGIAIVCAVTLTFIVLEFVADKVRSKSSNSKKRNRIKFYVARNKNGSLYLYRGKPSRGDYNFYGYIFSFNLKSFGLNENDYKDLKWEDEPVEVFLNMDD